MDDNTFHARVADADLGISRRLDGAIRYNVSGDVVDYVLAADLPESEFEAPGEKVWIEWRRNGVDVGYLLHEHAGSLSMSAIIDEGQGPELLSLTHIDDPLIVLGFVVQGGDDVRKILVEQVFLGNDEVRQVSFGDLS